MYTPGKGRKRSRQTAGGERRRTKELGSLSRKGVCMERKSRIFLVTAQVAVLGAPTQTCFTRLPGRQWGKGGCRRATAHGVVMDVDAV